MPDTAGLVRVSHTILDAEFSYREHNRIVGIVLDGVIAVRIASAIGQQPNLFWLGPTEQFSAAVYTPAQLPSVAISDAPNLEDPIQSARSLSRLRRRPWAIRKYR